MIPQEDAPIRYKYWERHTRVDPQTGCIIWFGASSAGYGKLNLGGKILWAHRVAYEEVNGPVPAYHELLHICDTPRCVNPQHMRVGTHQANMIDRVTKGKHAGANKTHCIRGHAFTTENTRMYRGRRNCRTCDNGARYAQPQTQGAS